MAGVKLTTAALHPKLTLELVGLGLFPSNVCRSQPFGSLCLVGEGLPRFLGPTTTLSHVVECRRFSLVPRLCGTSEAEVEV